MKILKKLEKELLRKLQKSEEEDLRLSIEDPVLTGQKLGYAGALALLRRMTEKIALKKLRDAYDLKKINKDEYKTFLTLEPSNECDEGCDEAMDDLRKYLPAGWEAEWVGFGDTDSNGVNTEDVRIYKKK